MIRYIMQYLLYAMVRFVKFLEILVNREVINTQKSKVLTFISQKII